MVKRDVLSNKGSLMLVKVELKKDFQGDIDQHIEEQISYIEKGTVEFEVGGTKSLLHKGDVTYIPSNVEHRVKVMEDCVILDVFTPIRKDLIK